jgi:hypothetical protein
VCIFIFPFFGLRIEWLPARRSAAFVKSRPNLAFDKMREAADEVVAARVPEEFYAVGPAICGARNEFCLARNAEPVY